VVSFIVNPRNENEKKGRTMINRRTVLIGGGVVALAGAGAAYIDVRDMGSMADYNASVAKTRIVLSEAPDIPELIRYATLAANSHNTQPWRFRVQPFGIDILPDFTRRLDAVDPDNHHLFASLGCAAENLSIAAAMRAKGGTLTFNPSGNGSVSLTYDDALPIESALFDAIPKRQSTRGDFDGRPVSDSDLASLMGAARLPGVNLVLVSERSQINKIRDLVIAGNNTQIADPAFLRELKHWLRFNSREALVQRDGLFSATTGNPALPTWLGSLAVDLTYRANSENERVARQIVSSAGLAVFLAEKDDPEHWMLAGRACQRFALQATALGMKVAFLNQPVEVPMLRPELAALVGYKGRRPDILMRFGYGEAMPYSARRQVEAVLV
jgi:hypothetical protein